MWKKLNRLRTNRIILSSVTLLLLILIASAIYFSPYYLDKTPPQVKIEGIKEKTGYREVIEFAVDSRDERIGIKEIKVLIDESNLEFKKRLDQHPKQHREIVKINTSEYSDGQHKLLIEVVDASWHHNHNNIEFEILFDNTSPQIELTLKPESVVQGNTLMIFASSNEALVNIKGRVFERTTEFYRNRTKTEDRPYYRSLIGISVNQEPGRYVLNITAEDKAITTRNRAGNRSERQKIVQVIKGKFEKGVVLLPEDKRRLLTDNEARKIDYTKRAKAYSQFEPRQLWQGKSIRPAKGRISSNFGKRRVYENGVRRSTHLGIDIAEVIGTPVKASNSGIVVLAEKLPISGNAVIINHGQKLFSVYYHLNTIHVHKGEKVKKRQLIGEIGTTGQSTGPHLHWGAQVDGVSVNPAEWTGKSFSYGED